MSRYNKTEFAPTALTYTGQEAAAGNNLANASADLGQAITNTGTQLAQKKKEMDARDDLASTSLFQTNLEAQVTIWDTEFKDDSEAYNTAYNEWVSKNSQGLSDNALVKTQELSNRFITLKNADFEVAELESQFETENLAIKTARESDYNEFNRYSEQGEHEVSTSYLSSYLDSVLADDTLTTEGKFQLIQSAKDSYALNAYQGIINKLVTNGSTEELAAFLKDVSNPNNRLASLIASEEENDLYASEETRDKVASAAANALQSLVSKTSATNKVLNDNVKNSLAGYLDRAKEGGLIKPESVTELLTLARATNDEIIIKDVESFITVNSYLNTDQVSEDGTVIPAFGNTTLRQMEDTLAQLRAHPDAADNKLLIDTAQAMYDNAKSAGIEYGVVRGWYEMAPLQFDAGLSDQLQIRKENQAIFNERMGGGSDVSLFTPEEIKTIAKNITDNPGLLSEFVEGLGSETPSVLAEIGVTNPIVGVAGNLYLDGKIALGDSLFEGQLIIDQLSEDVAFKEITIAAQEFISGAYGLSPEHERAVRDAVLARAAFNAKLDGKPLNSDNWEEYYEAALKEVVPPIVTLDSSELNQYKITSPNPNWSHDEAQDKTEDWIEGLDLTDFGGVDEELALAILDDVDTWGDYGFDDYQLVPFDGGYRIRQLYPPGFVRQDNGEEFVLRWKAKGGPAVVIEETPVTAIPEVIVEESTQPLAEEEKKREALLSRRRNA